MRTILIALLLPVFALANEQRPTPAPTPPKTSPQAAYVIVDETQLFQVVLLRASRKGDSDLDGLPKSAEKAIADVRDFLPFKSYRLLDSALVRLSPGASGGVTIAQYDVKFSYQRRDDKLNIWFFQVLPAKKVEQPQPPGALHGGPFFAPEAVRPLISTSFAMDRGETVVVGSSKLNGDEALIVLLTAVPQR